MVTWLATTMFQLPVFQPDDILNGFDYAKAENQEAVMIRQLDRDDPCLAVIPWPCVPWGGWSRFQLARGCTTAEDDTSKRAEAQELRIFSAKVAKHRLERCRMVLMENPWASDAWENETL